MPSWIIQPLRVLNNNDNFAATGTGEQNFHQQWMKLKVSLNWLQHQLTHNRYCS